MQQQFKQSLRLPLILALLLALSGCKTILQNKAVCSADLTEMYVISKYGSIGISTEIAKDDAAIFCKAPLFKALSEL